MKKIISFLLVLLALVPLSYAASFEVHTSPVTDSIAAGKQAEFAIEIINTGTSADTFRFLYDDVLWSVSSDPLHHYFSGIDIAPGKSQAVRLLVNPVGRFDYGQYRLVLTLKSQVTGEEQVVPLLITLRPERPLIREYLAAVRRIVEIPALIDPREEFAVKVNLINRNPKNLSDVQIVFSSELINRKVNTSLGPLESKVITEYFRLDPLTPPQKGTLKVELLVDGSILDPTINEPYQIGTYPDIVLNATKTERFFLKTIEHSTYANRGNVEGSRVVESRTNWFKNLFTKTSPSAFEIKKDGGRYLAWELNLAPTHSATLTRTVSYRPLLVVFGLLAAVVVVYLWLRSPVQLIKKASILTLNEGGISEVKVILHVRNRSSQPFERLTVTDRIPAAAVNVSAADKGSAEPVVQGEPGGKTVVRWEIERLEKNEEMILSYRWKSNLAILGSISLPPAVVRFYSIKGTKMITRSNSVKVTV